MIALHKSELFQAAVSLLYPATCTICGKHIRADEYLCDGCESKVIHEFKYNRQIHLRHLIASWLRAALDDERLRDHHFDVILPVPLHPARQRERGFTQASLLAELLSSYTSIP